MNKKGVLIGVIVVVLLIVALMVGKYNSLVSLQSSVENENANIATQLQRRTDLIPNLVSTVKSFTKHETDVFDSVTKARETMLSANSMEEKSAANEEMTTALNKLIAVAEAYPELKSDTVYVGLMDELAGTENRISISRRDYNEAVTLYNRELKKIPTVFFANALGFEKSDLFEATEGALNVPQVTLE